MQDFKRRQIGRNYWTINKVRFHEIFIVQRNAALRPYQTGQKAGRDATKLQVKRH